MHVPVLKSEVLKFAREVNPNSILDGTFGRGGHTRAFLEEFPAAQITALDQDIAAIAFGTAEFAGAVSAGRLHLRHFNFHQIVDLKPRPSDGFDLILLDLGVSSPQLDEAHRGFSFYQDGPLDMRMNQTVGQTAGEVINSWSEVELIELFRKYGEISRPERVVRALVNDRKTSPFASTLQLAGLIERVEGWHRKGHHPATRYFLALRLVVNHELSGLESCLREMMILLSPRGRLLIITFHSLEDRIIKYAFRDAPDLGYPLVKKVIVPEREELLENPRSRSAKLRVFQRGSPP